MTAARNRAGSAACVIGFVALLRAIAPDPALREAWLYLVALPIGYGHLAGGLWFAGRQLRGLAPTGTQPWLWAAFLGVGALNLLAFYTWMLQQRGAAPHVLAPMLLLSAWHIVENDLALGRAYRSGLALPRLKTSARHQGAALGLTAAVGLAALLTPSGAAFASAWLGRDAPPIAPFSLDELATAVLLYHAASWARFFWDRARRLARRDPRGARRLRQRLLLLHAVPLASNAAVYVLAPVAHLWLASPGLYLFWSVLHAVQTASVRTRSVRGPAPERS